jgi:hypothetical protein
VLAVLAVCKLLSIKVNIFQNLTFTYSREQLISKTLWFILAEDEGDDGVINDNIFSELVIKGEGDFLTEPDIYEEEQYERSFVFCIMV